MSVAKSVTLRLSKIPISLSKEALEQDLESLYSPAAGNVTGALNTLKIRSLAKKSTRFSCATFTIKTSVPRATVAAALREAFSDTDYTVDSDFFGITPLYEGEIADDICDVVAVPGLNSNAVASWKAQSSDEVWLRDWLPEDLPNTRVLVYGYDTRLLNSQNLSSIEDLAGEFLRSLGAYRSSTNTSNRPVLFIGHSLGGLLIKDGRHSLTTGLLIGPALVQAYRSTETQPVYKELYRMCRGLVFYGVPHQGLRHQALVALVEGKPNHKMVESLVETNDGEPSSYLGRLSEDFSRCFQGETRVMSWFEREKSPLVKLVDRNLKTADEYDLLVKKNSATKTGLTGVPDENNNPLTADHSGLVKFDSSEDDSYVRVKETIKTWIRASGSGFHGARESQPQLLKVSGHSVPQVLQQGNTFSGTNNVGQGGSINQGVNSYVYR